MAMARLDMFCSLCINIKLWVSLYRRAGIFNFNIFLKKKEDMEHIRKEEIGNPSSGKGCEIVTDL
jgi:hypothetical protein